MQTVQASFETLDVHPVARGEYSLAKSLRVFRQLAEVLLSVLGRSSCTML